MTPVPRKPAAVAREPGFDPSLPVCDWKPPAAWSLLCRTAAAASEASQATGGWAGVVDSFWRSEFKSTP